MKTTLFGDFSPEYRDKENAKVIIVPIPYDGTSTWIKGADKGPNAILEASYNLEFYDIETNSEVYTKGIYTDEPVKEKKSPESMVKATERRISEWLKKDKFIVTLGGEHSVTIGTVQAFSKKYHDLSVLQLDAHTDLRDSYLGSKNNHACVMARIKNICPIVQVGIRSMDKEETSSVTADRIFYAKNIYDNNAWMEKAISKLTKNVYLTIDLDVLDPSIMPSTGTPEPGGLGWYSILEFIKKISTNCTIVGFDIVELCPNKNNKAPDFLAAKLIYKILSYIYYGK